MQNLTENSFSFGNLTNHLHEVVARLSRELYVQYALKFPRLAADLLEVLLVAEAEAWESSVPHLLLPDLVEVKVAQLLLHDETMEVEVQSLALAA